VLTFPHGEWACIFLIVALALGAFALGICGLCGLSLCEPLGALYAFCQYPHEQGVTHRRMSAQDIFVPESLQSVKV
jgi:hypothetical protein